MHDEAEGIVRRDFPARGDGYDRAAVDAHLETVAARVAAARSSVADRELLRAGRVVLDEVAALRRELERVSDALRDHSAALARTLDELHDLEADSAGPGPDRPPGATSGDAPSGRPPPVPPARAEAVAASDDRQPSAQPPLPAVPQDAASDATSADAAILADARLVALDMALGGSSREQIEAELAARFELPDPAGLTDEVLAAIG